MSRPTAHQTMFAIARETAKRSTCPAARVGAVIAKDGVIVSVGYNGAPRKVQHCEDAGCVVIPADIRYGGWDDSAYFALHHREYSRHLHAEINAILHCARDGRSTDGCEIYVTLPPCLDCAKALIQASITRIHVAADEGNTYDEWRSTVGRFLSGHVGVEWHYST